MCSIETFGHNLRSHSISSVIRLETLPQMMYHHSTLDAMICWIMNETGFQNMRLVTYEMDMSFIFSKDIDSLVYHTFLSRNDTSRHIFVHSIKCSVGTSPITCDTFNSQESSKMPTILRENHTLLCMLWSPMPYLVETCTSLFLLVDICGTE